MKQTLEILLAGALALSGCSGKVEPEGPKDLSTDISKVALYDGALGDFTNKVPGIDIMDPGMNTSSSCLKPESNSTSFCIQVFKVEVIRPVKLS